MTMSTHDFDAEFSNSGEWATMYRRRCGLQVVPAVGKRPALPWRHLQDELISDNLFNQWYGDKGAFSRQDQMGLITGKASGNIGVIDLDDHKTAAADMWWRGITAEFNNQMDIETWEQTTGGGGRQKLLRFPVGFHIPTCKTSIGVDIRGQGGFAVLPPSRHDSGKTYQWKPGRAPYECAVAEAPDWLCAAIVALAEEHGGTVIPFQRGERVPGTEEFNAFGLRVDGREDAMSKLIWRHYLTLYRDCPIKPPRADLVAALKEAWAEYESKTKSRLTGDKSNTEKLELEERGPTEFSRKWWATLVKWDDRISEEAKEPPPEPKVRLDEPPVADPNKRLILTDTAFLSTFSPPAYLVDGIIQRGYLYSLTARTGHGKTAISMYLMQAIARGRRVQMREVEEGAVLFCAGENPSDIQARYLVLCDKMGFKPGEFPIHFIDGVIDIEKELPRIRAECEAIPNLKLVIVDTAAAYFQGDEDNSNTQKGQFARVLRQLSFLPGKPAVVVPCHPTKDAPKDRLSPVGGGAFLNEVDGNLTLWTDDREVTTLHWHGKFRGPEFEPIAFKMETVTSDSVKDAKGRLMPSVVAEPIGEMEIAHADAKALTNENLLLGIINGNRPLSVADLARKAGWLDAKGAPQKSKVARILIGLATAKPPLVKMGRDKHYRLTEDGQSEVDGND